MRNVNYEIRARYNLKYISSDLIFMILNF